MKIKVPVCRKCGVILIDENWYPSFRGTDKNYICKACLYERTQARRRRLIEKKRLERIDRVPVCNDCGVELNDLNWYTSSRRQQSYRCIECCSKKAKRYRDGHKEEITKRKHAWYAARGGRTMKENRECTLFLGVHVAERVLSHVFKDVERMPMNNPGYDVICNHDKLIDIKSSCRIRRQGKRDSWVFSIKYNKIADYFLLIGFDNRDDLNPEHVWLMPGHVVNEHATASIFESNLKKWGDYSVDVSKVIDCCNIMKS